MNKKILLVLVIVVLAAAGGFYIYKSGLPAKGIAEEINKEVELADTQAAPSPSGSTSQIAPTPSSAPTEADIQSFTVTGKNFSYTPSLITVKKGDRVRINFVNNDGFHDWKIDELNLATKKLAKGASETLEFTADKAGSFEYYCSVGEHRIMGMKGVLKVE